MALAANPFLLHPAIAAPDQDLEICLRAKALGYEESKEPVIGHEVLSKTERCTKAFWARFKPQPLDQILNEHDQVVYHEEIERGDCAQAENLLRERFGTAHPDTPSKPLDDMILDYWQLNLERHFYPGLGLCTDLQTVKKSLKEIAAKGVEVRPFWNLRQNFYPHSTKFPYLIRRMYAGVAMMIYGLARTKSPKVALALLRLSREGKAVKFHPHYELYLALRLQGFGVEDPLIDTVIKGNFEPAERTRVAKKAKQKNSTGIPMFPD